MFKSPCIIFLFNIFCFVSIKKKKKSSSLKINLDENLRSYQGKGLSLASIQQGQNQQHATKRRPYKVLVLITTLCACEEKYQLTLPLYIA